MKLSCSIVSLFISIYLSVQVPFLSKVPPTKNLAIPSIINQDLALEKLQEYLRIPSSHLGPQQFPNYTDSVKFLTSYGLELGLKVQIFTCKPGKPSVILSWLPKGEVGKKKDSLVLNSHMDTVPVDPSSWTYPPFNATLSLDKDGERMVVGRGSQDCKSLTIMYLEAIRTLQTLPQFQQGPSRPVHLTVVPDEEVGAKDGMVCFSQDLQFTNMLGNVGLVLDEGFSSPSDSIGVFYGERTQMGFQVIAKGDTGHGSQFIGNLATDKLAVFESEARLFRYQQQRKLHHQNLDIGDVTTINLNYIRAGKALNVVPDLVEAWFDLRVSPKTDLHQLEGKIRGWADLAQVQVHFFYKESPHLTKIEPRWWKVIENAANKTTQKVKPLIFPAATDSRFLRKRQLPALGLTPISNHPDLAHKNDEYLKLGSFYKAIQFYTELLPELFQVV